MLSNWDDEIPGRTDSGQVTAVELELEDSGICYRLLRAMIVESILSHYPHINPDSLAGDNILTFLVSQEIKYDLKRWVREYFSKNSLSSMNPKERDVAFTAICSSKIYQECFNVDEKGSAILQELQGNYGFSQLHEAVNRHDLIEVRRLIEEESFPLTIRDSLGLTAFERAQLLGDKAIALYLKNAE